MKKFLLGLLGAAFFATQALAVSVPLFTGPGPNEPSQIESTLNTLIQEMNALINAQTTATWSNSRNYLDNGDMWVNIRGYNLQTCGTTGIPETAYSADRWGCIVNVGSGAGQMQVTTTPTPPLGFVQEEQLVRNSGSLTQPVCAFQEVPASRAIQLQGKVVTLSAYAEALAGLSADNGNLFNMYILTGTLGDQGLQTFSTQANAITPAWTNIVSQNTSVGLSTAAANQFTLSATAWTRYNTGQVLIPTTTNEIAVAICFTPASGSGGSTDGFAFTGVQLEQVDSLNTAGTPSTYEFKNPMEELLETQRFAVSLKEGAVSVNDAVGYTYSANGCLFTYNFPVPMLSIPSLSEIGTAIANGTTFKLNNANGVTNILTWSSNSTQVASYWVNANSSNMTVGNACTLNGLSGGAIILWAHDY